MAGRIVRCAIIGAGLMGTRHATFLAGRSNAKLVAIADMRPGVAEKVTSMTGGLAYVSYEQMLDREKLDLVLVETPDSLHKDPAITCCQARVPNLIIQKPLSVTVGDAIAIIKAAEASGTRVFAWYSNRGAGSCMATHYAIRSGLIGRVVYGDITTDDDVGVPLRMWEERSRDWVANSSPAQFLTTHAVDRVLWYVAPARVEQVYAMDQREILHHTVDLYDAFLFFDNGLKVRVKSGWVHYLDTVAESFEQYNGVDGQVINNRSARFAAVQGWRVNFGKEPTFDELRYHQEVLRKRGLGTRIIWRAPLNSGWNRGITAGLEILGSDFSEAPNHDMLEFVLDAVAENTVEPGSWKAWQGDGPLPMADVALENVRILNAIEQSARQAVPVRIVYN
jgi:predicted dehydrogenase